MLSTHFLYHLEPEPRKMFYSFLNYLTRTSLIYSTIELHVRTLNETICLSFTIFTNIIFCYFSGGRQDRPIWRALIVLSISLRDYMVSRLRPLVTALTLTHLNKIILSKQFWDSLRNSTKSLLLNIYGWFLYSKINRFLLKWSFWANLFMKKWHLHEFFWNIN